MEADNNAEWSEPVDDEVEIIDSNDKETREEQVNDKSDDSAKTKQQKYVKTLKLKSALITEPKKDTIDSDEMLWFDDDWKDNQKIDDAGGNYEDEFDKAAKEEIEDLNDNNEFWQNDGFDILQELEDENRVNQAILKSEEEERIKEAQSSNEDNLFTKKEPSIDLSQNDSFPGLVTKCK